MLPAEFYTLTENYKKSLFPFAGAGIFVFIYC